MCVYVCGILRLMPYLWRYKRHFVITLVNEKNYYKETKIEKSYCIMKYSFDTKTNKQVSSFFFLGINNFCVIFPEKSKIKYYQQQQQNIVKIEKEWC